MNKPVLKNPLGITIRGNWFYQGWLESTLGIPKRRWDAFDPSYLVEDDDVDAYEDGYSMSTETGDFPISVIKEVIAKGQLTVLILEPDIGANK